jgi:WD40 repeat protein
LQIVQIFTCLDAISRIEWSPDSQMLLAAQYKRALVQMFSLERPTWVCRIDEGPVGLTYARWAPDSRHVLTSSDFSLRLTIWSLVDRSSAYIRQPKFAAKGCEFSHDGRFLAVVERREYKDMIGIYATDTWELVKHFAVDAVDLEDLAWSPDDRFIAIWDTPLEVF